MYKVLVFAGTTEGYEICRFLADHKIETKGFVATEYGSKSLTENEFLTVQTGRLDAADMEEVFLQEKPEMVLDATHPYAAEVTVNIRTACENTQTAYYRVLREAGEHWMLHYHFLSKHSSTSFKNISLSFDFQFIFNPPESNCI